MEEIDRKSIASCIEANPGMIGGFKLRLVGPVVQERGEDVIRLSKEIASEHKLPLMVHIGDGRHPDRARAGELTRFLLKTLTAGDILTHLCTPNPGGVMSASEAAASVVPEVEEARANGVVIDSALGRGNFGIDVAPRMASAWTTSWARWRSDVKQTSPSSTSSKATGSSPTPPVRRLLAATLWCRCKRSVQAKRSRPTGARTPGAGSPNRRDWLCRAAAGAGSPRYLPGHRRRISPPAPAAWGSCRAHGRLRRPAGSNRVGPPRHGPGSAAARAVCGLARPHRPR